MLPDPIACALETPGHLWFPSNFDLAKHLEQAGGRVERRSTGHLVFYRSDGRRFLATDPAGNPLHECEWQTSASGIAVLTRARFRLDWGQWVGLKPSGLVNQTTLNLASKSGWQRITPDDLRAMAAHALRVPIEEVRWFYRDEDLKIDEKGMATIRHRKDAFYTLDEGGFDRARFMSCMGAMHWEQIDFLPVVELFKSLLPGTGSAAFELIRGLYDDQNQGQRVPRSLRYRGIPTYPSEAAFRLFSGFFVPKAPGGSDPLTLFMDSARAHQVVWSPGGQPPVRYFDSSQGLCITMHGDILQKATLADDSAGVSYVNPSGRRIVPLDRSLRVSGEHLIVRDRADERRFQLTASTSPISDDTPDVPASPLDWRTVFIHGVPPIRPSEAYGAVLYYPEDHQEIAELSAQPFVADYLQDLGEQDREIGVMVSRAERVWIDNGDAVITSCILFDRPREYTACFRHAAYAQRQAQQLWTQCAEVQRWGWIQHIHFVPAETRDDSVPVQSSYDLVYQWVPYEWFDCPSELTLRLERLTQILRAGGHAFVTGPSALRDLFSRQKLQMCWEESVDQLPTFRMHRTILQQAQVKAGLTLFHVRSL